MPFGDIVQQAAAHAMFGNAPQWKGLLEGTELALFRDCGRRIKDVRLNKKLVLRH